MLSLIIFLIIVIFILRAATRNLNASLPKSGKGKKAKGGGDAVASWTEGVLTSVGKGIGRAFWNIVTAPFRK